MPDDIDAWRSRIQIDPAIHHGDPCIAGTRVPVAVIVGSVADGDSWETIIRSYPQLTSDDIQAALRFAVEVLKGHGRELIELYPEAEAELRAVAAQAEADRELGLGPTPEELAREYEGLKRQSANSSYKAAERRANLSTMR